MFTSTTDFAQMNAISIAESPSAPQVVYLDFDGAATSYVNADLGVAIDNVTVEDSGFFESDIAVIVDALNGMFDDVSFTSALPADGEFSTIYVGVTSAFDKHGSFLGLAETIDSGNIIRDDNAFVLLDSSTSTELVVSVIAHETEHIVHGMDHGGEGLERFAAPDVAYGQISLSTTLSNDKMKVYSNGMALLTTLNSKGVMNVYSYGNAQYTTVNAGGVIQVYSFGIAHNTTVNKDGVMHVYNGGQAYITTVNSDGLMRVFADGMVPLTTVNSGGTMIVYSQGQAHNTTVNNGGDMIVYLGGQVQFTTVNGGFMDVLDGGTATSTTMSDGTMWVSDGGMAVSTTVVGGCLYIRRGGIHSGTLQIADGGEVKITDPRVAIDFTVAEQKDRNVALINRYDYIRGGATPTFTITVSGGEEGGRYALAGYASAFKSMVTVKTTAGAQIGALTVDGQSFDYKAKTYNLGMDGTTLVLDISKDITLPTVTELTIGKPDKDGTAVVSVVASEALSKGLYSWNGGEWTELPEDMTLTVSEKGYVRFQLKDLAGNVTTTEEYAINAYNVLLTDVKCQTDGSNAIVDWSGDEAMEWSRSYDARVSNGDGVVVVDGLAPSGLELLNLPTGEMGVSVKPGLSDVWTELNALEISDVSDDSSIAVAGEENGLPEVMFARGGSVWGGGYRAWHAGGGDWGVAGQTVELDGKNRLDDIFIGSDDATLLLLSDDDNGDALFVDDIYSAFPERIDVQARVAKIDEIRAGAGDDVVDLTSPRFKYVGDGLTIRGGLGDDVIWANGGSNRLFGDAGDDRIVGADGNDVIVGGAGNDAMPGGGGDDIFCFCGGWGNDTVEQLATGTVTLWFADGDKSKWDAEKLTYTDGENSVTVTGVADVTLLFGNADERYDGLLAAGAFAPFSSEKIFEEQNLLVGEENFR